MNKWSFISKNGLKRKLEPLRGSNFFFDATIYYIFYYFQS